MSHSWGEYHRGCRCDFCMRRRLRSDKHRLMYGHNLTGASFAQAVVVGLLAEGFTIDTISTATKMSRTALGALPTRKRVRKETDARFRALTRQGLIACTPDDREVPAVGVYRRARAMMRLGWTRESLGRTRAEWATLRAVLDGRQHRVKAGFHRHIQRLYDERSMTLGPHAGNRTRFAREGYPPPLAWSDDSIDDPSAVPDLGEQADVFAAFLEDAVELWETGEDVEQVCRRLGVSLAAAEMRMRRHHNGHPLAAALRCRMAEKRRVA